MFPDIVPALRAKAPDVRGRLLANQPLAELTWFRVGGPAQALFMPEDEADLAYLLRNLPAEIPATVVGLGSNLIVRDGGVPGVVIRLGRGFSDIKVEGTSVTAGTGVPDVKVARAAQEAGIAGLSFMRGIPGAIGGALRMNGGAYGRETKDVMVSARAVDRKGNIRVLSNADMGFHYRHTDRGLKVGQAQVSEMHCNFLINLGGATATEIETLGETVRKKVQESSGVALEWEIKRIGIPAN
jgi:UDP-N-acetylmuramate dehydrogenase